MKLFSLLLFVLLLSFAGCKEDTPIAPEVIDLSPPQNVQLELETGGAIKLTWENRSSGHNGFYIERKTSGIDTYQVIGTATEDVTVFRDISTKAADSIYFYRIYAFNGEEKGEYSNEVSLNLSFPPPSGVAISSSDINSINLIWTDVSTIELGYQIERKSGTELYQVIGNVDANITSFSDTSMLMGETVYDYRVKAIGDRFLSSPSAAASVTTGFPAPSNLTINIISEDNIVFDWDNVEGSELYVIFMKDSMNNYIEVDSVKSDNSSYQYNNVIKVNQNYTFSVMAKSSRRISKYSNDVIGQLEFKAPELSADQITGDMVQLSWIDNTSFEQRFELQRKDGSSAFVIIDSIIAANSTAFIDSFVVDTNVTYMYRLRAVSPKGNVSAYSVDSIILSAPAPTQLIAGSLNGNTVTLQWNDNSRSEIGFIIEEMNLTTGEKTIHKCEKNQTKYTATNLNKKQVYHFKVRAEMQNYMTEYSNIVKVH